MTKALYLFVLSIFFLASRDIQPQSLEVFEEQITKIVDLAKHSVVSIVSHKEEKNVTRYSGVILNSEGYIVTVVGAVEKTVKVCARFDSGEEFPARLIGTDVQTHLALLKIDPPRNLTVLEKGDSSKLRVGSILISIGNPYGLPKSASLGIVSGLDRCVSLNDFLLTGLIQTTAPLNPGDAGGIVVDSKGKFVGMVCSTLGEQSVGLPNALGPQGINFILPGNTISWVAQQLILHGKVKRGWVGIRVEDRGTQKLGVVITDVVKDGPADKCGLKIGDILLTMNDQPIYNSILLLHSISHICSGETIQLKIERNENSHLMNLILEEKH